MLLESKLNVKLKTSRFIPGIMIVIAIVIKTHIEKKKKTNQKLLGLIIDGCYKVAPAQFPGKIAFSYSSSSVLTYCAGTLRGSFYSGKG